MFMAEEVQVWIWVRKEGIPESEDDVSDEGGMRGGGISLAGRYFFVGGCSLWESGGRSIGREGFAGD